MSVQTVREPISERRIRRAVQGALTSNRLCSISTVAHGNRAHINTAFFAFSPNLEVYFLSDPGSLLCRNIETNPSMAMTIFDSRQRWDAPGRGIQLFGIGNRTHGEQARRAAQVYGSRFPHLGHWLKGRTPADRQRSALLQSYALYRFLPARVKVLDEAEFGGATFVIATVRRSRSERGPAGSRLAWQTTEVLVPDSTRYHFAGARAGLHA